MSQVVAKIILRAPDNTILLLRRVASDSHRPSQLDFPGGGVDDNEDFGAAVSREVMEETGQQVEAEDCELVYTYTAMKGVTNIIRLFYLATTRTKEATLQPEEHDEAHWLSLDDAIAQHDYPLHRQVLSYIRDNQLL